MKTPALKIYSFLLLLLMPVMALQAQTGATVNAQLDANRIMVGDQIRMFIEAQQNKSEGSLQWAVLPDTFNKLEIVEKGKIDTIANGDIITYKQRLLVTGFDSGVFVIPRFTFTAIPNSGDPYIIQTDSFPVLVQTVEVDTTKPFIGIKGIMHVQSKWTDYIWYVIGGLLFIGLAIFVFFYFIRNKKTTMPVVKPTEPVKSLQEQALEMLAKLEQKQLWQSGQVKEYYSELTDIIRSYIEARYDVATLELTTDEILQSAKRHSELSRHTELLSSILYLADLAKFAKAEPLPHEHTSAMEHAVQFINVTKPAITETPKQS